MVITQIEHTDNGRYRIYVNGECQFSLYGKELKKYSLEEGQRVSEDLVGSILSDIILPRCKKRALHMLERRDYTKASIMQKLQSAEYPVHIIESVIEYLQEYHYLDDIRYARRYIDSRHDSFSRFDITRVLKHKGIHEDDIEEAFLQVEDTRDIDFDEAEKEYAKKCFHKKLKQLGTSNPDISGWNKVYHFMAYRGIPAHTIQSVIRQYKDNMEQWC